MVETGTILSLDNEKLIVLTSFVEQGRKYSFVNKILDDESDITGDYYLLVLKEDGYKKVLDEDFIMKLYPLIQTNLKRELENNGIKIGEANE